LGILNEKDIYSPKWVTAEITDSKGELHFVPIKHEIGEHFIAEIDNKYYVFSLRNARIVSYRKTLARSFRKVYYDTTHSRAINGEKYDAIYKMLTKNGLPKLNRRSLNVLRVVGKREKYDKDGKYVPQKIEDVIAVFVERGGDVWKKKVRELTDFIRELGVDEIVTPVRQITDFIQEDLVAENPSYLGEAIPFYQRLDMEHKIIANKEIKGTRNLGKIMLIVMAVVIVVALVFIAYDQGWFKFAEDLAGNVSTIQDGFKGIPTPGIPQKAGAGKGECSDAYLQANYTPEALKVAIENGQVDYDCMSDNMKTLVGDVKAPTVRAP
jgi:hypothetical protein